MAPSCGAEIAVTQQDIPSMGETFALNRLIRAGKPFLAYRASTGTGPQTVWLGGLRSDMEGGKATAFHQQAAMRGEAFLRFDYRGHGLSEGRFEEATISDWLEDTLAMLDMQTKGDLILIGSSLGGWLAMLATLARPERVKGLLLIAPAPDFTQTLMWDQFAQTVRDEILQNGYWMRPSDHEAPYPITRALIEDGRSHLLLGKPVAISCPVTIVQGQGDDAVPWEHSLQIARDIATSDVRLVLIKDADHRLSRDDDIARLLSEHGLLSERVRR
jgi:pimeloyl-ACP methyl ester carboxylesterase